MAKILILIRAHLRMARRPQKEAEPLASAGHDVTVRGFWLDHKLADRGRNLLIGKRCPKSHAGEVRRTVGALLLRVAVNQLL